MSLIALILTAMALCLSLFTLWRQDIHRRDLAAPDRVAEQDYAALALDIAHIRREIEDAGLLDDPDADLDLPHVPDRREELEADGWEEYGMDQRLPLDDRLGRVRYIRYTPLREDT